MQDKKFTEMCKHNPSNFQLQRENEFQVKVIEHTGNGTISFLIGRDLGFIVSRNLQNTPSRERSQQTNFVQSIVLFDEETNYLSQPISISVDVLKL